ncbi:hypothetical protein AKJ16_DCAP08344 [Drosera capensis]
MEVEEGPKVAAWSRTSPLDHIVRIRGLLLTKAHYSRIDIFRSKTTHSPSKKLVFTSASWENDIIYRRHPLQLDKY